MRVVLEGKPALPLEFDVVIPDRLETHRMRIVWRSDHALGLGAVDTVIPLHPRAS